MINSPKVAVVILNWNGQAYLQKFLPSVLQSTYPNLEIIVGDNASGDNSVSFLRDNYPEVKVIQNDQNYGFAGGYNEVLKSVEADYFVLLNSDVEVTSAWLEPVISLMESNPNIAVAQPKLLAFNNKDKFEYAGAAGGYLDKFGYAFCKGRIFDSLEKDHGQYDQPAEIFWASGAAFFIKKSCWIESGGLDEDFFAHMEEIDLCWRLKNSGYIIMYCPDSVVYHVGGGTLNVESPFKTYLNFRNNLVMLQKNLPFKKALLVIFIRFWLDLLSIFKYLSQGNVPNAMAVSKAHFHFLGKLSINRKKRIKDFSRLNSAGIYKRSIVWQYFGLGKKYFSELKERDFKQNP
ncbi:glycosyltransferase family 2 protein [Daejeonella oryzae]|uniref:glycosyltransferase family 2 protein n=1 Tax=Daejeonella oryzae TaxID=1122943 RepID=UPI0003FE0EF8|nr:glycosyltransferase family 2 protein [Daejeonella oryzae]